MYFRYLYIRGPQVLPRFSSKIAEVIGMDTIVSLDVEIWLADLPNGMWEAYFLDPNESPMVIM